MLHSDLLKQCCQVREGLKKGSLQARASKANFETVLADERIKFQLGEERNQRQFSRHDGHATLKSCLKQLLLLVGTKTLVLVRLCGVCSHIYGFRSVWLH